jgi:hypothetical protein
MQPKKKSAQLASVLKFKDLKPKKDPKGGALNAFQPATSGPKPVTGEWTWNDGG